jgi:ATP-dependent DNA helicase RecG
VALLHGQLSSRDKAAAMESFAAREADVLVATTVIEVGIDVPNATVMLVEDADRYGISQLHQLRGRVGPRRARVAVPALRPADSRRLKALAEHTDGFRLAEIDLELRGEGELTGTRQSGLARFAFARLPDDGELLARAHARRARPARRRSGPRAARARPAGRPPGRRSRPSPWPHERSCG